MRSETVNNIVDVTTSLTGLQRSISAITADGIGLKERQ